MEEVPGEAVDGELGSIGAMSRAHPLVITDLFEPGTDRVRGGFELIGDDGGILQVVATVHRGLVLIPVGELRRILGEHRPGTMAEYVVVPAANVRAIPDEIDFETAAAFPLATLTAWRMIVTRARVQPGDVIATVFHSLGLKLDSHLPGPAGRPFPLVDFGYREIHELF